MFKAVYIPTGEEIIILHPKWAGLIGELRTHSAADALICQGCRQPVRVRAGEIRQRYFAHKHLENCSYPRASFALLQARAVLYQFLVAAYGDAVTVEKQVDEPGFPRPVDCWVQRPSGAIAYWIMDAGMRLQARADLIEGFRRLGVRVIWVLAKEILHAAETDSTAAHLTTTERDLMQKSSFDDAMRPHGFISGKSLHYLDADAETLTTFRKLELIHPPQVFKGRREDHPLSEVMIATKTGEFAHPGERERWEAVCAEKKRLKREETERREQQARLEKERMEAQARRAAIRDTRPNSSMPPLSQDVRNRYDAAGKPDDRADAPLPLSKRQYTCEHCGEQKSADECWGYDGATQTGQCHVCSKKGLW